jgi:DNA-binding transcriptional regulator YhcF (GntR family)
MQLRGDDHSPLPIRRQLLEQLKYFIEGGGFPRDQALPSIRELAGFLGINPNTVARVSEDLGLAGYVEARRGKGVFVAQAATPRSFCAGVRSARAVASGGRTDPRAPGAGEDGQLEAWRVR